ncbi:MAG: Unknown protein [uncultured Aureispira sp.]|uniref:Phosphodiester glycosidase domain-containing protein n=1 Tax=uncultured Aureispira sp. TaxID=1331704 RepID=A0A6S6TBH5_9BACT|nr:MAG: Unknown protein [uncultured Aureispira sp.]
MKRLLFVLGWSILISLFWSCHQNIKAGENVSNFLSKKDSTKPDSIPLLKEDTLAAAALIEGAYEQVFFKNTPYAVNVVVFEVKLDTAEIALIDNQYQSLNHAYQAHPRDYLMLTNGGMFHPRGIPVGLFVEETVESVGLNFDEDRGNFFLLPNGVFFVSCDHVAGVLETEQFRDSIYQKGTPLKLATQSGPMLVIDSLRHPKFNKNSPNNYIRSGVGVTADQKIIFILSKEAVNFYTFASIFLEKGCKNALYLDGAISDMYIKGQKKDIANFATRFGPVIGVFSESDTSVTIKQSPSLDTIPSTNPINVKDEN